MPKHPLLNFTAPSQRTKQLTVAVILILIVANCSNKRHDCEFTATCTAESREVGNAGGTSGQGNTASAVAGLVGTAGTDAGAGASATGGQFQASACCETCPKDKPLCDEAKASCVTCLSDNDCASTPETPACTIYTSNECVECLQDTHCPAALSHCLGSMKCAECSRNEHCSGATPYCNMDTHKCVECRGSSECDATSAKPVCNPKNLCVPCLYDYHCKTAEASRCDTATNNCAPCQSDENCYPPTGAPACVIGSGDQPNRCAQCSLTNQSQCGSKGCNLTTNVCNP